MTRDSPDSYNFTILDGQLFQLLYSWFHRPPWDSVTMDLDEPLDRVWRAALEELRSQGSLKRENANRRRLDARIQQADVVVTLKQLTSSTVRVVVRARKNLLPKVEVAQAVSVAILRRVGPARQPF